MPEESFPPAVAPMLATTAAELPDGDEWVFELKWDGIRALAFTADGAARLVSRNGNDLTARWPVLQQLPEPLDGRQVVLDGEVVAFDAAGRPSFSALQEGGHAHGLAYVVFDVLHLDGHSLRDLPWADRRPALERLAPVGACWQMPPAWDDGEALQEASRERRLEGVMAKRRSSAYAAGRRSREWRKIKNVCRQEFVIGGWVGGSGNRHGRLGALLLGYHETGRDGRPLRFAGRVGTGFTNEELARLEGLLAALATDASPFEERVPHKGCHFVRPELVAEVEFTEWTHLGTLRHPSYKGLRDDKDPTDIVKEDGVV